MPKDLSEFEKLEEIESHVANQKVNWEDVARKINESHKSWSAREIWQSPEFVALKVSSYRTKKALDDLARPIKKRPALIRRRWDGKAFWYGPKKIEKV